MLCHRLRRIDLFFSSKARTSLSKAYDLIQRFSKDIDISLFREDLGQNATVKDFQHSQINSASAGSMPFATPAAAISPVHSKMN